MKKSKFLTLLFAAAAVSPAVAQDGGAKIFGGSGQFRTWSIGVNAGVTAPKVFIGGHNDYNDANYQLGYGAYIQKQISPAFGLKLDYQGGNVSAKWKANGNDNDAYGQTRPGYDRFDTKLNYATSLQAQVDLTSLVLKRDSKVALYVQGGYGITGFDPGDGKKRTEQFIPVGGGLKFKLSEGINLDLGYTMNFLDADNFDRTWFGPSNDKWSYGYAGLNFALGSKSKKNLDWVNPYALMYDELKDNQLKEEVEALKSRVSQNESAVSNLKKDGDNDGVSDVFDKEPNTPAGNVVDGAGRTIVFPKAKEVVQPKVITQETTKRITSEFKNILFDNGKATIRPESMSIITKAASELEGSDAKFYVDGYTDNTGNAAANKTLSQKRAEAVANALIENGVSSSQVKARGFGASNPKCSNKTAAGKQCNRRVEIKLQ